MFSMCKYDRKAAALCPNDHPLAGADHLNFVRRLKKIGLDNGIHCNQSHAPFPTRVPEIRALGPRLQALHFQDTDQWHDSHQLPFSMQIDFLPIVQALKEMGYPGYFTLEADQYLKDRTPETVLEGIKEMAASAKRLADLFEKV